MTKTNEKSTYQVQSVFFVCADGSIVDNNEARLAFNEEYLR